mmetsp:Transcript_136115/g.422924  ORF Transcript_136115/g.422924 Transcript_136115/m.422924 type:complete len:583 (+) Transcript_136115:188-1936(+)
MIIAPTPHGRGRGGPAAPPLRAPPRPREGGGGESLLEAGRSRAAAARPALRPGAPRGSSPGAPRCAPSAADRHEGPREAQGRDAAVEAAADLPPGLVVVGAVLRVDPAPDEGVERRGVPGLAELPVLPDLGEVAVLHDPRLGHAQQVRRPALEVVEDVRAIEDRGPAELALRAHEAQDALAREEVEVGGDLVHEVEGPGGGEQLQQLAAPALAVRDLVDLPLEVDLEDVAEVPAARRRRDLAHQVDDPQVHEEVRPPPIAAVHNILRDAGVVEGVLAQDLGEAPGDHPLAPEDGQQRGLARPVGAHDEDAGAVREGEGHLRELQGAAGHVGVGEVAGLERRPVPGHDLVLVRQRVERHRGVVVLEDPLLHQGVERATRAVGHLLVVLRELVHAAAPGNARLREVEHVAGPLRQVVEDVGRVEDGGALLLRLLPQEPQQALPGEEVQVRRDLVEDVNGLLLRQALQELAAPALAIRDGVDPPGDVDLHDVYELLDALGGQHLLADQLRHTDVEEEVGAPPIAAIHALPVQRGVVEDRLAQHLALVAGDHPLPAHDGQQRRLPGAVGPRHEHASARLEGDVDVD